MASKGGRKGQNAYAASNSAQSDAFSWKSLKPMPTRRVFSTGVVVDGQLHVLGGCDAKGVPVDNLESYNAKKNQWNRLLNMPTPRAGVCAVSVDKKLLTFGGVNVRQEPTDVVEIYDSEKKCWQAADQSIDTMKERLLGCSAITRDKKAIVIGGMGFDTNPKDYIMSYDIATNRWQSLPPMPTPRYATFSFLIDDRLYVLGGRQGKVPVDAFEVFDFKESLWKRLPNIPTKRVFSLYSCSDQQLFSVGGLSDNQRVGFSGAMETFDIRNQEWMLGKETPTKRGDFAIGFQDGKVIAAGGLGNTGKPLTEVEAYDFMTDEWSTLPPMPNAHSSCAYCIFEDKLTVAGGLTMGGPSSAVDVLVSPSN